MTINSRLVWVHLLLALLLTAFILIPITVHADKRAHNLYRFAIYVKSWPQTDTLNFCVIGSAAFANTLRKTLKGKNINGRKLVVKEVKGDCHLLFGYNQYVSSGKGVLTVSTKKGFAKKGGMIEFITQNSFNINQTAARKKGVYLSSQLLKLAKRTF